MSTPSWAHFDPQRFDRQMAATRLAKVGLFGAVIGGWLLSGSFVGLLGLVGLILLMTGLAGWLLGNVVSNRTGRLVVSCAQMAAMNPASAEVETAIAQAMKRFTLYRTVRVMLYHQLAVLRHVRNEHAEAVAICHALLSLPNLGMGGSLRNRLLLILADSSLRLNDLPTTWHALSQLAGRPLELTESLQLLEIQTRYEILCGYDRQALQSLENKVATAELLPPMQCANVHRLLGDAAERCGHRQTSHWLHERAELMTPRHPDNAPPPIVADGLVEP